MPEITLEPLAMQAALTFWKDKLRMDSKSFYRLQDEARTRAFAVSGMAKDAELETVFQAISKAIENGTTLAEFKRDCAEIFAKRGWEGKRARRIETIFRTNIQTAYNVGRYQMQKERSKHFPYLQYQAVNDSRTRPAHLEMNGKVFPFEHKVWDIWYPPNGFNCRCSTRLLSKGQVKRLGLKVEEEDPTYKLREMPDPKTGNKLPARTLMPDSGWMYNPGKTVWGGLLKEKEKPGKWQDMPLGKGHPLAAMQTLLDPPPSARLLFGNQEDDYYASRFASLYGSGRVVRDPLGDPVLISPRILQADKSKEPGSDLKTEKMGHGEVIPWLADMVHRAFEIWIVPQRQENTGRWRLVKRYIDLWQGKYGKVGAMAIFEMKDGVMQGVTAFAPRKGTDLSYLDRQRVGIRLYRKGKVQKKK